MLHQSAKHVLNDLLNLSVEDKVQVLENIENTIGAANMVRNLSIINMKFMLWQYIAIL